MGKKELIQCFEDTLAYSNGQFRELTKESIASNKIYKEGFESELSSADVDLKGQIEVVEMSSFDAARHYYSAGSKIAVLNFANPVNPGGGVANGAMAQEECLCRSSNLYLCLVADNVQEDYYRYHKHLNNGLASDRLIYTKDVLVFKDDGTVPKFLLNDRIKVDVITCAAPYRPSLKTTSDSELQEIFKIRIKNILEVAVDNGIDILILGAFGCGAFANPPKIVAEAFKEAIENGNYLSRIPTIVFAIKKSRNNNYQVFCNCFKAKDKKITKNKTKKSGKKKDDFVFKSVDSLQQVVNVVNESAMALNDEKRTIKESPLGEVLLGALGAGFGGAGSFVALYGLGTVGLSAAGITSGLAAAGGIVGGGMVAGIFALAAPVAVLAGGGVALGAFLKNKQVKQERIRLYKEALAKHQAIIEELKKENDENKERLDYLQSLNILLMQALKDLKHDIEVSEQYDVLNGEA